MNTYLMAGSSITSNRPLMAFTGTDPEYSVEDYLNSVTANLILNIGPEPINTPLHQNLIQRLTALIQTTLDGAAQKWFSVLTRNLTQEDTQTPSHFVKEEIIETIVTTTQQSIFHQYVQILQRQDLRNQHYHR